MQPARLRGEASALPRERGVGAFPGEPRPAPVGIGPRSEGGFGIGVQLEVSLPGVPRAEAQALVKKAYEVCPYSNATRNNVPVRLNVV